MKRTVECWTLNDFHMKHVELWNWLSNNPGKRKVDWPGWSEIDIYIESNCFCCEETDYCSKCMLQWPEVEDGYNTCASLYGDWVRATNRLDLDEATKLAEQIRDLPLKKEYEE